MFQIIDTQTGRTILDNVSFDKACTKCDKLNLKANCSRYRMVEQAADSTVGLN